MEFRRVLDTDIVRKLVELPPECADTDEPDWSCPLSSSSEDSWIWNSLQSGHPAKLVVLDDTTVVFHPIWSNSTVGVRGTRLLNGGLFYWEIAFGIRVFGSAMMVGISTPASRLESSGFDAIIGENEHSWGLSHTGYLHHNGKSRYYCSPFEENVPTVVGVLFNGRNGGTLTFFKDGKDLGEAFRDINQTAARQELYPTVSSTAAKTAMRVQNMRRGYYNLRDRCRDVILRSISDPGDTVNALNRLPLSLRRYVVQQSWKVNQKRLCG